MRAPDSASAREETLRRLAIIARVPEQRRSDFYKLVLGRHVYRWEMDQKRRAGSAFSRKGALAKAARGMRMARDALFQLSDSERKRLDLALHALGLDKEFLIGEDYFRAPFAQGFIDCEEIAHTFARLLDWATGADPHRIDVERCRPGRRKGMVYPQVEGLVHTLMRAAELCSGRLTLDRHNKSGTLLEALELVRQTSPPGFIPKALSLASVERARNSYRRNSRKMDELMREYRGKEREQVEF
jgi:hypothetical protein